MDRNEDPGANTEMFRVYVQDGEPPRDGRAVGWTAVLVVALIVVAVLGVLVVV